MSPRELTLPKFRLLWASWAADRQKQYAQGLLFHRPLCSLAGATSPELEWTCKTLQRWVLLAACMGLTHYPWVDYQVGREAMPQLRNQLSWEPAGGWGN